MAKTTLDKKSKEKLDWELVASFDKALEDLRQGRYAIVRRPKA